MEAQLLIGSVVLLAAIAAARLGARAGLPSLLLFLGLGMLLGDAGLGIRFSDATTAHHLGFAALVLILAEGGLTTKWRDVRPALGVAGLLATLGILASVGLVATFCVLVLHWSWAMGILVGAILSPTDSAAVFSVLRRVPLPKRLTAILEGESGLNDAPTVILVTLATGLVMGDTPAGGPLGVAGLVAFELVGGLAIGLAVGVVGALVLRSIALPSTGLAPLAALGWCVMAYGLGWWLHTSGFAAVYVCAVILGNANLPHRLATRSFVEGVGWISQIGLFVMLGLLASPKMFTVTDVLFAIALGVFLTFVARPLSVLLCTLPFRMPWRHQVFISWAGLRGAVPIILATIPMAAGVPQAAGIFDVIFVFVIAFTLLQGPTLPWLARTLGLGGGNVSEIEVESAPLQKINAELIHTRIPVSSRLQGVTIRELRLPAEVVVSLVVRGQETFSPQEHDVIRAGDELLIVAPGHLRAFVEDRLRDVDTGGRLANWHQVRTTGATLAPRPWRRQRESSGGPDRA